MASSTTVWLCAKTELNQIDNQEGSSGGEIVGVTSAILSALIMLTIASYIDSVGLNKFHDMISKVTTSNLKAGLVVL